MKSPRIRLAILGATGTIGRLTADVAEHYDDRIEVVALAAQARVEPLADLAKRLRPARIALADPAAIAHFRAVAGDFAGELLAGPEAAAQIAGHADVDVVVNGIVGAAGLAPSLAALSAGHRLALANKESLVMAGGLIRAALAEFGGEMIPVDSEHSAIFECLANRPAGAVRRLILTASGGPLRHHSRAELDRVTPEEALQHPTWTMGARITIDSATLFNNGMELIEASSLFDVPIARTAVWVHPQSIVHGLIELSDGSLIAQLSKPDMRLPIQRAISYPEHWDQIIERCDLPTCADLTFEAPDESRFPCLALARQAGAVGGTAPTALNASDEVLVRAFLERRIPFPGIAAGLQAVLRAHEVTPQPDLEQIFATDAWARRTADEFIAAQFRGSVG